MGTPGSGKTMLAKDYLSILPPLTFEEALQVTRIHSIAGILPAKSPCLLPDLQKPTSYNFSHKPNRWWKIPKPGEISLAHYGVLLDEVLEFDKYTPGSNETALEDGVITVSRLSGSITYPAEITLILTGNPCPCGYRNDDTKNVLVLTMKLKII